MLEAPTTAGQTPLHLLVALIVILLLGAPAAAEGPPDCHEILPDAGADSPQILLLTAGPGDDVFNIFGHSALWVRHRGGAEVVYDFGVIGADQEDLLVLFVQGALDFYLRARSLERALDFYAQQDRPVVAQPLDLPAGMGLALVGLLEREARPEHRDYRYHWTEANCSTRIRDALDTLTGGELAAQLTARANTTPRREVLRHLAANWPIWFGWHFSVSGSADRPLSLWEAAFVPDRLQEIVGLVQITWPDLTVRPLAPSVCVLRAGRDTWAPAAPPDWNTGVWVSGALLAGIFMFLGLLGRRFGVARRLYGVAVCAYGLLASAIGGASLFAWSTSVYVGLHASLNLLVAGPQSLALIGVGLLTLRAETSCRIERCLAYALAGLGLVGLAAAVLPLASQDMLGPVGFFLLPTLAIAWVARARKPHSQSSRRA